MRWGAPCTFWESWPLPATHFEQGIALMTPSSTAPLPSCMGMIPGWLAYPMQPWPCGVLAIRTRP